jgi:hypothetical protein
MSGAVEDRVFDFEPPPKPRFGGYNFGGLKASHPTVRTAREQSGFKGGLCQREESASSVGREPFGTST